MILQRSPDGGVMTDINISLREEAFSCLEVTTGSFTAYYVIVVGRSLLGRVTEFSLEFVV